MARGDGFWYDESKLPRWAQAKIAALERKTALMEGLLTALSRLYTFPGVRDLLAPKESLGSIAAEVEVAIAKAEALIGSAKG